ncbi:hypothetical protein NHX12_011669 [Muraenolepis orangiensis]|uniref:Uncharacterized protein n=1 Tax=Muraenolepis orangiensis TaxID=630683 RepID=A0A9Q0DGA5_9TELE|nr:hypothetical protein NHX12_011669 [Muraenolepis orangiensis]
MPPVQRTMSDLRSRAEGGLQGQMVGCGEAPLQWKGTSSMVSKMKPPRLPVYDSVTMVSSRACWLTDGWLVGFRNGLDNAVLSCRCILTLGLPAEAPTVVLKQLVVFAFGD